MLLRQIILRARGAHGDSLDGRISVSKLLGNPSLVAYAVWESGAECLDTDFYWGLLCLSYECVINVNSMCLQSQSAAVLLTSSFLRTYGANGPSTLCISGSPRTLVFKSTRP